MDGSSEREPPVRFAELCARTCFSFLQGASHPEEMVERAHELGLESIALCDRDGLYGSARAHVAARKVDQPVIVGAEMTIADTQSVVLLLAEAHAGYANLCRLLTRAHADQEKGTAKLEVDQLAGASKGLWAMLPAPYDESLCASVVDAFGTGHVRIAVQRLLDPAQRANEQHALALSSRFEVPLIATTRALMHHPSRKPLADVLACIRHKTTLDEAGSVLQLNAEAVLRSGEWMGRRFRDHPEWLEATLEVAQACRFSLSELHYRFPCEGSVHGRDSRRGSGATGGERSSRGAIRRARLPRCSRSSARSSSSSASSASRPTS